MTQSIYGMELKIDDILLLQHALGLNRIETVYKKLKRRRTAIAHRNYLCMSERGQLKKLLDMGLLDYRGRFDGESCYYSVSEKGIELLEAISDYKIKEKENK